MKVPRFRLRTLMIAVAITGLVFGLAECCRRLVNAGRSPFEIVVIFLVVIVGGRLLISVNYPQWHVPHYRLIRDKREWSDSE
jgi:hypothetical protein